MRSSSIPFGPSPLRFGNALGSFLPGRSRNLPYGSPGYEHAGIDICRLDDSGKVVERWDALQVVPDASANDNTMF